MKNKLYIIFLFFLSCVPNNNENNTLNNESKTNDSMIEVNKLLIKKDIEKIKGFIKRHNWNMIESKTGLWYEITNNGTGFNAKAGMTATINYKISLLDGDVCYDSFLLGPKIFKIGEGGVEQGLEEGILLLKTGSKARFILPPHMAYGIPGDNDKIPPRSIIIYELELVSLKK